MGDNPGNTEGKEKQFFMGKSGENLNNFLKDFLECENEEDYLFLNKMFFHTPKTDDLKEKFNSKENKRLFSEHQKKMLS